MLITAMVLIISLAAGCGTTDSSESDSSNDSVNASIVTETSELDKPENEATPVKLSVEEAFAEIDESVEFLMNAKQSDAVNTYTLKVSNNSLYDFQGVEYKVILKDENENQIFLYTTSSDSILSSYDSHEFSFDADVFASDYEVQWNYNYAIPVSESNFFPEGILGRYESSSETTIIQRHRVIHYHGYSQNNYHNTKIILYNGEICLFEDYNISMGALFVLRDGDTYWHLVDVDTNGNISIYKHKYDDTGEYEKLTKTSDSAEPLKEPSIGMTADEVRESTWGEPQKINKTTTAYGVHEQWVYSTSRYIYLDDEKVTSIQE